MAKARKNMHRVVRSSIPPSKDECEFWEWMRAIEPPPSYWDLLPSELQQMIELMGRRMLAVDLGCILTMAVLKMLPGMMLRCLAIKCDTPYEDHKWHELMRQPRRIDWLCPPEDLSLHPNQPDWGWARARIRYVQQHVVSTDEELARASARLCAARKSGCEWAPPRRVPKLWPGGTRAGWFKNTLVDEQL